MRWYRVPMAGARTLGPSIDRPGFVQVVAVGQPGPDDVDLSEMEAWGAVKGSLSYLVSCDARFPERGWRATVKAIAGRKVNRPLVVLVNGAQTKEEAQAACAAHWRGRAN